MFDPTGSPENSSTPRARAYIERQRAAGFRPVTVLLPIDLVRRIDETARAKGQSRREFLTEVFAENPELLKE